MGRLRGRLTRVLGAQDGSTANTADLLRIVEDMNMLDKRRAVDQASQSRYHVLECSFRSIVTV